jgi:hypothetical protein
MIIPKGGVNPMILWEYSNDHPPNEMDPIGPMGV